MVGRIVAIAVHRADTIDVRSGLRPSDPNADDVAGIARVVDGGECLDDVAVHRVDGCPVDDERAADRGHDPDAVIVVVGGFRAGILDSYQSAAQIPEPG